jgi:hypothetical protein
MAGLGDEIAAGAGGRGHLRASHADREQVIGTLKSAFVQGMLAKDEFDQRVGQALASRTYAELAALTADLPAGLAAALPPKPARAGGQPVLRPGQIATGATMLYTGAWVYALLSPKAGENPVPAVLVFLGGFVYLLVLAVAAGVAHENRQDKRSGGQRPWGHAPGAGGPAFRCLPPTGPGARLPPVDPGRRYTAEAARRRRLRRLLPVRGHCADGVLAAGTVPASG